MRFDNGDDEFQNYDGDPLPYLPNEGIYAARLERAEQVRSLRGEKLKVTWTVFQFPGLQQPVVLYRHYNLYRTDRGRRRFSPNQSLWRDFTSLNNGFPPKRGDSLSLNRFRDQLFFVEVVTVKHDSERKPLNPGIYYSKVGRVIRPLAEDEPVLTTPAQDIDIGWKRP
jgi:hypothetical protein